MRIERGTIQKMAFWLLFSTIVAMVICDFIKGATIWLADYEGIGVYLISEVIGLLFTYAFYVHCTKKPRYCGY